MRSSILRDGLMSERPRVPHPVASVGKCIAFFICEAVSPFAPPYVMANAIEMLAGENARLPGFLAAALPQKSIANSLLPAARSEASFGGSTTGPDGVVAAL